MSLISLLPPTVAMSGRRARAGAAAARSISPTVRGIVRQRPVPCPEFLECARSLYEKPRQHIVVGRLIFANPDRLSFGRSFKLTFWDLKRGSVHNRKRDRGFRRRDDRGKLSVFQEMRFPILDPFFDVWNAPMNHATELRTDCNLPGLSAAFNEACYFLIHAL